MAKKKKRKSARSKKSNPSTKARRKKKRRNPASASASPKRRKGKGRRKARRNSAHRAPRHAKKHGKRRKAGAILDLAKAAGVGLVTAGVIGVGTFLVAQKVGNNGAITAQKLRMVQGAAVLAGGGIAYLVATKGKSPLLGAAVAAGALAGAAGPELAAHAIKAIATQQNPQAAAQAQATTNGIGALGLRQPGMGQLALGMGAVDQFAEPVDF